MCHVTVCIEYYQVSGRYLKLTSGSLPRTFLLPRLSTGQHSLEYGEEVNTMDNCSNCMDRQGRGDGQVDHCSLSLNLSISLLITLL